MSFPTQPMPLFHPKRAELEAGIAQLREQLLEALIRLNNLKDCPLEADQLRELVVKIHTLVDEAARDADGEGLG